MKSFGFALYAAEPFWNLDPEFQTARESLRGVGIEMRVRKYVLYRMAKSVRDLDGDTVECGCFKGEGSYLICLGTGARDDRYHHVFDSFEGLSGPTDEDLRQGSKTTTWAKHDLSEALSSVGERLKSFPWVRYHPGWIPTQFHNIADRRFSLVHIDVDLYQPTRDSLEFFYERTVPGGLIICDDYAFTDGPGATKACDEFFRNKPEATVIYLGTGQGFVVKRARRVDDHGYEV